MKIDDEIKMCDIHRLAISARSAMTTNLSPSQWWSQIKPELKTHESMIKIRYESIYNSWYDFFDQLISESSKFQNKQQGQSKMDITKFRTRKKQLERDIAVVISEQINKFRDETTMAPNQVSVTIFRERTIGDEYSNYVVGGIQTEFDI
jgi:hypothetical protein